MTSMNSFKGVLSQVPLPEHNMAYHNSVFVSPQLGLAPGTVLRLCGPNKRPSVYPCQPHDKVDVGCVALSALQRSGLLDQSTAAGTVEYQVETVPMSQLSGRSLASLTFAASVLTQQSIVISEDEIVDTILRSWRRLPRVNTRFPFAENQVLVVRVGKALLKLEVMNAGPTGAVFIDESSPEECSTDIRVVLHPKCTKLTITPSSQRGGQQLFATEWRFEELGIGGLDAEFGTIFRRAFASRTYPADVVRRLEIQHVRGVLLYGPPGTGKTLIARKIGELLNCKEPIIVSGPEILNSFVGKSEEAVRKLFEPAEQEQREKGDKSALHLIIFDEIDAICRKRASVGGGAGGHVNDTVVNQLLAKLDGVDQLNNILVIGMTNRLDIIDTALLRPGRFEVHVEIGLADEDGRESILRIHTRRLRENGFLGGDVSLRELARRTRNFSGAELRGLVTSAQSFAFSGDIDVTKDDWQEHLTAERFANLKVCMRHFEAAMREVLPAFGVAGDKLAQYAPHGLINYGDPHEELLHSLQMMIEQVRSPQSRTPKLAVMLHGAAGSGKTALACELARRSGYPFVRVISPDDLIGQSEAGKVQEIRTVFDDAAKSPLSLVVLDNIERLIGYVAIGARFSNNVLQALLALVARAPPRDPPRRLLVMATTSHKRVLDELDVGSVFDVFVPVPPLLLQQHVPRLKQLVHAIGARVAGESPAQQEEELRRIAELFTRPLGIKRVLSVLELAIVEGQSQEGRQDSVRLVSRQAVLRSLRDAGVAFTLPNADVAFQPHAGVAFQPPGADIANQLATSDSELSYLLETATMVKDMAIEVQESGHMDEKTEERFRDYETMVNSCMSEHPALLSVVANIRKAFAKTQTS